MALPLTSFLETKTVHGPNILNFYLTTTHKLILPHHWWRTRILETFGGEPYRIVSTKLGQHQTSVLTNPRIDGFWKIIDSDAITVLSASLAYAVTAPCDGSAGKAHPNGGGFVASTATVSPAAYVAKEASICMSAKVYGKARILDQAVVTGMAEVFDFAEVSGQSSVVDRARVYGNSKVAGKVQIRSQVSASGKIKISGDGFAYGLGEVKKDLQLVGGQSKSID